VGWREVRTQDFMTNAANVCLTRGSRLFKQISDGVVLHELSCPLHSNTEVIKRQSQSCPCHPALRVRRTVFVKTLHVRLWITAVAKQPVSCELHTLRDHFPHETVMNLEPFSDGVKHLIFAVCRNRLITSLRIKPGEDIECSIF